MLRRLLASALARMIAVTTTACRWGYAHAPSYALPRGGDAWPMRALRRNRPARARTAAAPSQGEIRGRLRVLRRRTDRTLGGESENLRTAAQGRQARG